MEKVKTKYYPNLRAEMARSGDNMADLAELLEISIPSVSRRLSNEVPFDVNECVILCNHYNVPFEVLFVKE